MNPLETAGVFILVTLGTACVLFVLGALAATVVVCLRDDDWEGAIAPGFFFLLIVGVLLLFAGWALK